ncbi:MAG: hypothetical protein RL385_3768 [Pseudomonadota bacterium]|jgi:hypothetical protein
MSGADLHEAWLGQRRYTDLLPEAERALRQAGLYFLDAPRAEACLREAQRLAPTHPAVLIGHYRFYLYKHRYVEAARCAQACVVMAAQGIHVADDALAVTSDMLADVVSERDLRAWLFSCQAYGYVLIRAGEAEAGRQLLAHVVSLDTANHTRTDALLSAIALADAPDEDA